MIKKGEGGFSVPLNGTQVSNKESNKDFSKINYENKNKEKFESTSKTKFRLYVEFWNIRFDGGIE